MTIEDRTLGDVFISRCEDKNTLQEIYLSPKFSPIIQMEKNRNHTISKSLKIVLQ